MPMHPIHPMAVVSSTTIPEDISHVDCFNFLMEQCRNEVDAIKEQRESGLIFARYISLCAYWPLILSPPHVQVLKYKRRDMRLSYQTILLILIAACCFISKSR